MKIGKVGPGLVSDAAAKDAARQTGLSVLASLRQHLGSLNYVKRVLKSLFFVNAVPEFEGHINVANGYAELLRDVFGEAGVGSRSAIGMGPLPFNVPVEVELMVEIDKPLKADNDSAASTANVDDRIKSMGLDLPPPAAPMGVYTPAIQISQMSSIPGRALLVVSGHGPMLKDRSFIQGKVGPGGPLSKDEGNLAARQTGLSILASLQSYLGSLNRVKQLLKSIVMVNCVYDFEDQVYVANGYSHLMAEVFGEKIGIGTRSAIGMGSLPKNISVEIELMVEVEVAGEVAGSAPSAGIDFSPEQRVSSLGLKLPPAPKPMGVYVPAIKVSDSLLLVSGHGPLHDDSSFTTGKCGSGALSVNEGKEAARQVGLAVLSTLRSQLNSLDRVKQILKSLVLVNCKADFEEHIAVANGYAELLRDVFGDRVGVGSRSAVGVPSLPKNITVEVELMVEIYPEQDAQPAKKARI